MYTKKGLICFQIKLFQYHLLLSSIGCFVILPKPKQLKELFWKGQLELKMNHDI